MNISTLHQSATSASEAIPPSVQRLDAILNHAVRASRTEEELQAHLQTKLEIKRRLAAVPDALLDEAARAVLAEMGGV